eukprot:504506_1
MSTKQINEMLITMGFKQNHIKRAFRVYELNYGYHYKIEVLTEIIVRLQKKDKTKAKKSKTKPKKKKAKVSSKRRNATVINHPKNASNSDSSDNIFSYNFGFSNASQESVVSDLSIALVSQNDISFDMKQINTNNGQISHVQSKSKRRKHYSNSNDLEYSFDEKYNHSYDGSSDIDETDRYRCRKKSVSIDLRKIVRKTSVPITRSKKYNPPPSRNININHKLKIEYNLPPNQSSETINSDFTIANEEDLKEELKELMEEFDIIKNRKYEPKSKNENIGSNNTFLTQQSSTEVIEMRNHFNSLDIHTIIYPYEQQKTLMVVPCYKECLHCFKYMSVYIFFCILIFGILGSLIFGGIATFFAAKNRWNYGQSFNIRGVCEVIDISKTCDSDETNNSCKYNHLFKLIGEDLETACKGIRTDFYQKGSYNEYELGETVYCFTNNGCDTILFTRNEYIDESGWIYFAAGLLFLTALCCLGIAMKNAIWRIIKKKKKKKNGNNFSANCKSFVKKVRGCCEYYNGKDKKIYYQNYWNKHMCFDDKLDYFIGFYRRTYKFNLSNNISNLIYEYGKFDNDDDIDEESHASIDLYEDDNNVKMKPYQQRHKNVKMKPYQSRFHYESSCSDSF